MRSTLDGAGVYRLKLDGDRSVLKMVFKSFLTMIHTVTAGIR